MLTWASFCNGLPGLATAFADRSPVFCVTSSPPLRDAETNCLQGFHDQVVLAKPVTKFAHRGGSVPAAALLESSTLRLTSQSDECWRDPTNCKSCLANRQLRDARPSTGRFSNRRLVYPRGERIDFVGQCNRFSRHPSWARSSCDWADSHTAGGSRATCHRHQHRCTRSEYCLGSTFTF